MKHDIDNYTIIKHGSCKNCVLYETTCSDFRERVKNGAYRCHNFYSGINIFGNLFKALREVILLEVGIRNKCLFYTRKAFTIYAWCFSGSPLTDKHTKKQLKKCEVHGNVKYFPKSKINELQALPERFDKRNKTHMIIKSMIEWFECNFSGSWFFSYFIQKRKSNKKVKGLIYKQYVIVLKAIRTYKLSKNLYRLNPNQITYKTSFLEVST